MAKLVILVKDPKNYQKNKKKKEYAFNNTESASDYNKIRIAESKSAVHPENRYNSVEEEEMNTSVDNKYISPDDLAGENEMDIITEIDERMDKEREKIEEAAELRDCGFFGIIDKLLKTADINKNYSEKENILNRLQSFMVDYKKIVDSNVPVDEEEKKIEQAFNKNFGNVAYSSDGSAELVNELMMVVKNAPKNRWRGEKIAPLSKNQPSSTSRFEVKKNKNGFGRELLRKIKIKW